MKISIKKIVGVTFLTVASLSLVTFAAAPAAKLISAYLKPDIKFIVDGAAKEFKDANGNTVYPIIYNGTTYLPIRAVSEYMGKPVSWNAKDQVVYLGQTEVGGKSLIALPDAGTGDFASKVTSKDQLVFNITEPVKETKTFNNAIKITNINTVPKSYSINLDSNYSALNSGIFYSGKAKATFQIKDHITGNVLYTRTINGGQYVIFEGVKLTDVKALEFSVTSETGEDGMAYFVEPSLN